MVEGKRKWSKLAIISFFVFAFGIITLYLLGLIPYDPLYRYENIIDLVYSLSSFCIILAFVLSIISLIIVYKKKQRGLFLALITLILSSLAMIIFIIGAVLYNT